MISSVLYCSDVHFFSFTQHLNWCLKLFSVATTIRSKLIVTSDCGDAVSTVSFHYKH